MTGKPRLRLGTSAFERTLLRSWEAEQPSPKAREKAMALMAGAAAIGVATKVGVAAAVAPKGAVALGWAAGKWILLATLVAGSATAVGVGLVSSPEAPPSPSTASPLASLPAKADARRPAAMSSTSASSPAASTVGPPPAAVPSASSSEKPHSSAKASTSQAAPSASAAPAASPAGRREEGNLMMEVTLIDGAHRALSAGNTTETLRLLDQHDCEFPHAMLGEEALALRIQALLQQGNRAAATALATRFVAAYPSSPLVARIRALLGADAP